jgi:hypothetical protein
MGWTSVNISLLGRLSRNVFSLQGHPLALLATLLLVVSLHMGSPATVSGGSRGSTQSGPGVRSGRGSSRAPNYASGRGRHLVMQVRGSC